MSVLKDLLAGKVAAVAPSAAAPAVTPAGATSAETLKNTLASFAAASRAGGVPRVNPPEAAAVLATKTTNEVAGGREEPELDGTEVEPPTSKPAAVVAAENAPRPRRTAVIVQAELDAALEENAQLRRIVNSTADSKELDEAKDMIAALRAEARVADEDLKKAHARAELLQETADLAEQLGAALVEARAQIGAAPNFSNAAQSADLSTRQLCALLNAQGFEVRLVTPAAS